MNPFTLVAVRGSYRRCFSRLGFTLVELLATMAIVITLGAVSTPVVGAIFRDVKLANAASRIRAAFQQSRLILNDQMRGDIPSLSNPRQVSVFSGVTAVFRRISAKGQYELFYAVNTASAVDSGGHSLVAMASPPTSPMCGYARFFKVEPIVIEGHIRLAGLRRNHAMPSGMELVPDSFAVCIAANMTAIPPAQKVYVNFQEPQLTDPAGSPSQYWDTAPYDPAAYNEDTGVGGEGFTTALPLIIIYLDDKLPHDEGGARVYRNADGSLNAALDPNELIRVTQGRLEMLSIQGAGQYSF